MLGSSWRTKLMGIGILALGFAGHPLNHYVPILGLNWATFCNSAVVLLTGGGLLLTKDYNVHGGTQDTGTRPAPIVTEVAKVNVAKSASRPPLP